MELHQYRTDGHLDITGLSLKDIPGAKMTALQLVEDWEQSGVYRIQFVDAQYDRISWDTHRLPSPPRVGALAFAGAS